MKTKILMYNTRTGDVKITAANIYGLIFKKLVLNGYKPIADIKGFDITLKELNRATLIEYTELIQ